MSQTPNLVQQHINAFNNRDVDALLTDFAPSAEWITGDYTVPKGQLREFFTSAMESLTPQLTLRRAIDGGNAVAIEMTEAWTHDSTAKSAELIAVFDLDAGKRGFTARAPQIRKPQRCSFSTGRQLRIISSAQQRIHSRQSSSCEDQPPTSRSVRQVAHLDVHDASRRERLFERFFVARP